MKHLIVLPGNSIKNKIWGERMLSHYADYFDTLYLQEYDHWNNEDTDIDFLQEEQKLREHVATLAKETQIFVLAKSAGSILLFGAVAGEVLHPVHVTFFGIPFEMAITDVFGGNWTMVDSFSVPAVAFHNAHDPIATYEYTKKIIDDRTKSISLITTAGSDHTYDDLETYDKYLLTIFDR
jgi:hypothetical protein